LFDENHDCDTTDETPQKRLRQLTLTRDKIENKRDMREGRKQKRKWKRGGGACTGDPMTSTNPNRRTPQTNVITAARKVMRHAISEELSICGWADSSSFIFWRIASPTTRERAASGRTARRRVLPRRA
jgi:hypothetical protein